CVPECAPARATGGRRGRTTPRWCKAGLTVLRAAGNAYDGTTPAQSWIASTGSHPWGISVGGAVTKDLSTEPNQSRGPSGFVRKPDVRAPTATTSAAIGASATDNKKLQNFAGTSGATPYAGAAALILRNCLRASDAATTPG